MIAIHHPKACLQGADNLMFYVTMFLKRCTMGTLIKRNSVLNYFEKGRLPILKGRELGRRKKVEDSSPYTEETCNNQVSNNRKDAPPLEEFSRAWGTNRQQCCSRGSSLVGNWTK